MSYKSILVNLDIDAAAAPTVKLALDLATRFKAKLIGFCAADAPLPMVVPEAGSIAIEVWQQMKDEIQQRLKELHAEFDKLVAGSVEAEWREQVGSPTYSLASTVRLADLIVTGASQGASTGDFYRSVDPGSLVLQAGRPVLVMAGGAERVLARKSLVAWKDTREARRAVADAVPLLGLADEVIVATVESSPDDNAMDSVRDVADFLGRHGVRARPEVLVAGDEGEVLTDFAKSIHADMVVSGAYGHSRVREWVFGGVTRSLLDEVGLNRFMSG